MDSVVTMFSMNGFSSYSVFMERTEWHIFVFIFVLNGLSGKLQAETYIVQGRVAEGDAQLGGYDSQASLAPSVLAAHRHTQMMMMYSLIVHGRRVDILGTN